MADARIFPTYSDTTYTDTEVAVKKMLFDEVLKENPLKMADKQFGLIKATATSSSRAVFDEVKNPELKAKIMDGMGIPKSAQDGATVSTIEDKSKKDGVSGTTVETMIRDKNGAAIARAYSTRVSSGDSTMERMVVSRVDEGGQNVITVTDRKLDRDGKPAETAETKVTADYEKNKMVVVKSVDGEVKSTMRTKIVLEDESPQAKIESNPEFDRLLAASQQTATSSIPMMTKPTDERGRG